MAPNAGEQDSYPIYTKTFLIYRLAPLFHGNITIDNAALRQYASQFRDLLTGEVLRGVRVGLGAEDEALARVGALRIVQWSLLSNEQNWQHGADVTQMAEEDTRILDGDAFGILVEIEYERATYSAILLHNNSKTRHKDAAGFSHFPLLLTRMPGHLRQTFLEFLASTFDTRASNLRLSSRFITVVLEKYMEDIVGGENVEMESASASHAFRTIVKDVLLTLSFDIPDATSSLKTVDITVSKDDITGMITRGRKLLQIESSKTNSNQAESGQPFTKALAHYINHHLAIDIESPYVNISKVACGAFVLGTEGKIKLSAPSDAGNEDDMQRKATKVLLESLVQLAQGGKLAVGLEVRS